MDVPTIMAHLRTHKKDAWCNLPHPSGDGGHLTIGEVADWRLYELATRHLATRLDYFHNFDIEAFISGLKQELVWTFVKKKEQEVNQRTVDKMLSASIKRAKKLHKALTHYIPCVLVSSSQPEAFRLGPVVFYRMEKFLSDHEQAFDASKERIRQDHIRRYQEAIAGGESADTIATPGVSAGIATRLVTETTQYFQNFKWIAIVSIPECDVKLSRERAERTIEAALDVLKLYFARLHGEGLRQGHSLGSPPKTANLTAEADGKFDFSYGWSTQDVPTGKGWMNVLKSPHDSYFRAAASTLYSCVDPQNSSHLVERFLDSMAWYGQAVSEPSTSVRIVKYVAALERLTITRKLESKLTATVIRRTALLSCDKTAEGYEKAEKDAERVYDCRSGLMHGSLSLFDRELHFVAPVAERITRIALFKCLRIFTDLASAVDGATGKHLEAEYLKMQDQFPKINVAEANEHGKSNTAN